MPNDTFGPMSVYASALQQEELWPSFDEDGKPLARPIVDMAPPHAINALHKLARWHHHLYNTATEAQYDETERAMFGSPLVAALIHQGLGPFYAGTFLRQSEADVVPHLDDVVASAEHGLSVEDAYDILIRMKDVHPSLDALHPVKLAVSLHHAYGAQFQHPQGE